MILSAVWRTGEIEWASSGYGPGRLSFQATRPLLGIPRLHPSIASWDPHCMTEIVAKLHGSVVVDE